MTQCGIPGQVWVPNYMIIMMDYACREDVLPGPPSLIIADQTDTKGPLIRI